MIQNTKQMIQLDNEGYYIGTTLCQESPLEAGVYLLPPDCINAAVPKPKANQKAKWIGSKWKYETFAEEPVLEAAQYVEPTYAELRAAAYPPITEYLDGIVKGDTQQIEAYIAGCKAVKALYPKPA